MKKNIQHAQIYVFQWFVVLTLFWILPVKLTNATNDGNETVVKGERPAIDLNSVPKQAMESGIIRIKFNRTLENYLDKMTFSKNTDGTIKFGIAEVDRLNRQFGVMQVKQTFEIALQNTIFTTRHRQWGLHLWYNLCVPAGTDIRSMVIAYSAIDDVEISEPVYKKKRIGTDINSAKTQLNGDTGAGSAIGDALNFVPNDLRFNEQWHYNNTGQQSGTVDADIDLPEAWEITKGSSSVVVAVIDGGISYTHADLAANMWPGIGFNFVTNSSTITPDDHATHVAGTIAANTNNGAGVSGIAGGTGSGDGIRLMSCEVFTDNSSGGFEVAPVWAADHDAAISQNSWGYNTVGTYEQAVLVAIDYFNANGGGGVLNGGITIFAAGNSNSQGLWYPGCYSGVFSVAATNNQDIKTWYSNYDNWVDISAPGGETNSVTARGVLSTITGNSYAFYQGTSMACPHVSGVAALIISLAPGELTPQDVKDILTSTTENINGLNPTYAGKMGSGRLNAYNALIAAQGYINPLFPAVPVSITATAIGTSQINLNWIPNATNDVVMLAYNTTNTFGVPAGNYTTGQTITGGGTVLYEGTLTSFQHLLLNPATSYYYALWSKNNGYYSAGSRRTSATTSCSVINNFPWTEGFENGGIIPQCWTQERDQYSEADWVFITGNGGSNPANAHSGAYNACLKDTSTSSDYTKLITPQINLSGLSSPKLTFWHIQQVYAPDQDRLTVYYRTSVTGLWILLADYQSNVASWTLRTINLPAASSDYYIAFEGNAKFGHGVCVDDVTISGTSGPTLTVTPANQNVSSLAGTTTFTVTSNSAWTASSNQTWCAITPSGTGNGTITATYTQNTLATPRVANITVTVIGLTPIIVTVTQAGAVLTLSVTPPNQSVTSAPGATSFSVTTNAITAWSATSDQTWCTVTPAGLGNGTITATYTQNTLLSSRVANINVTVAGVSPVVVTVSQAGSSPTLSVAPPNQNVTSPAGFTTFNVTSNSAWIVSSDQTWCTVSPSGTGNGTITANYTENTSVTTRVANITVSVAGLSPVVVLVNQTGSTPTLAVTPSNQNVTSPAGNTSFTVTTNSSWTASSDQEWCSVTPSGTGNSSLIATYLENISITPRIANITVLVNGLGPVVATVTQAGVSPTLGVTPDHRNVTIAAGTTNFSVASNSTWTASSNGSWCTVTLSGNGNGTIDAVYQENTGLNPRTAIITVSVAGVTPITVTVFQEGVVGLGDKPQNNIVLFPNPNKGKFSISSTNHNILTMEVQVLAMDGKVISTSKCADMDTYTFDLSGQPKGNYLVRIMTTEGTSTRKVIIE
ncbi:MAG: S8 family serine peptidase [Bacteroidetes bacterium]|nr:S8 family serine peptidase [Bacteroidota bacterium]